MAIIPAGGGGPTGGREDPYAGGGGGPTPGASGPIPPGGGG